MSYDIVHEFYTCVRKNTYIHFIYTKIWKRNSTDLNRSDLIIRSASLKRVHTFLSDFPLPLCRLSFLISQRLPRKEQRNPRCLPFVRERNLRTLHELSIGRESDVQKSTRADRLHFNVTHTLTLTLNYSRKLDAATKRYDYRLILINLTRQTLDYTVTSPSEQESIWPH